MDIQAKKQELCLSSERLVLKEKQEIEMKIKEEIEKQITQEMEEYTRKTRVNISEKVWKTRKGIL